ncbi:hypothetical protein LPB03_09110 [Polaribacter vadi]|uniref:Uncharacterized protein n=1 Tax=Polaribacter vadi TaxID=1774273 RepID=A0A1B8U3P6_9FLAO|nr:hypothetical protein [Polaribacter vadi]AOW17615.1 hypothetical protein LPB03_09110 [Polaribacter vadi]OBY66498.1 hypothetical protein LPB3_00425 [Polaribacter vadi]
MKKNKGLKYFLISFGAFGLFLLSFTIIYDLLIPDVCFYHVNEMNAFMKLFYSAGGADNGHPGPNFLNFILSSFIGGLVGYKFYLLIIRSNKK